MIQVVIAFINKLLFNYIPLTLIY